MHFYSKLGLTIFTSTSLFLAGCQTTIKPNPPTISQNVTPQDIEEQRNQFSLQGKIGVRTPQQSGSAFFTWVQQQDQFDIELSGILGIGKTQISGQPGQVELNSSRTGLITAQSPEELLQRATGWQAPITYIIDWVQARPATTTAQILKDDQMRPTQFIEDGWIVDLSYNENASLPNRLILKQILESGQENRITMVIQNR